MAPNALRMRSPQPQSPSAHPSAKCVARWQWLQECRNAPAFPLTSRPRCVHSLAGRTASPQPPARNHPALRPPAVRAASEAARDSDSMAAPPTLSFWTVAAPVPNGPARHARPALSHRPTPAAPLPPRRLRAPPPLPCRHRRAPRPAARSERHTHLLAFLLDLLGAEIVARERVGVLVRDDLVTRGRALPGGDHRPREEDLPQAVERALGGDVELGHVELRILLELGLCAVRHPVVVPRLERVRVVAADSLDRVHLEAGHLELLDVPVERRRRVGAREDVARHEEAPLRVLPVGALAQARDLHVEEAVVV
mmetsp:Transcript_76490/g.203201  ORF Transcript_76490/g.203201 Transcript_76490/m.203201 type:complete len:310 (+) Transcript_76490:180-1109(+)